MIARPPEADLAGQAPEDPMDILVQQPAAALGDEEMRAAVCPEMSLPSLGVAVQRCFFKGALQHIEVSRLPSDEPGVTASSPRSKR